MKKCNLFLLLIFLCHLGTAQVLFHQDFDKDIIAPMTSVDGDGFTPRYDLEHVGNSWKAINGRAYAVSRFTEPNQAENWLIAPAISITQANTFLRWYSSSSTYSTLESYKILVSTTTAELDQFTEEIFHLERAGIREYHSLKLDAFIGDTILIAFVHQTYHGRVLCLDDIIVEVEEEATTSGKVYMYVDTYPFYKKNNTPMTLDVFIYNDSGEDISDARLFYLNDGMEKGIEEIENISSSKTIKVNMISEDQSEKEDIILRLKSSDGTLLSIAQTSVQILKNAPQKRILIEENSATWCGGCPRAMVFFENMKNAHAGDYVGIAVHEMDTMSLQPEHSIGSYPTAIRGIPSISLERFFHHVDPIDAEAYFVELEESLASPFDLKVNTTYNETDRMVDITISSTSITDLDNLSDRFRISILLTEDQVRGTSEEFDQANWYSRYEDMQSAAGTVNWKDLPNPVPASEMVYNKVLRAMLTPYYGEENSLPVLIEQGKESLYTIQYQVPLEFDPTTSNIIAIIFDGKNNTSINAMSIPITSTTTATHELGQYELEIYPNPTREELVIKQNGFLPLQYKLFSVDGKTFKQGILDAQHTVLNTSILTKGIYFLEVWDTTTNEGVIEKIEKL